MLTVILGPVFVIRATTTMTELTCLAAPVNNVSNHSMFCLSPFLTGLRLFCHSWRQTSRMGHKAVLKQSPVIRYFLPCVAKKCKVVAEILNMFKSFMQQNSSQNSRKVIAGVSKSSRTCVNPLQFSRNHFGTRHICEINKTELRTKCELKLVSHWDASNWRLFRGYFETRIAKEIRHSNYFHIAVTPNGCLRHFCDSHTNVVQLSHESLANVARYLRDILAIFGRHSHDVHPMKSQTFITIHRFTTFSRTSRVCRATFMRMSHDGFARNDKPRKINILANFRLRKYQVARRN